MLSTDDAPQAENNAKSDAKKGARQGSRRWSDRFPLDLEASVIADGRKIECQAVNISVSGARVRMESTAGIDGAVLLKIPRAGVDCIAEIIWSDDTDIGVKFKKKRRWYHRRAPQSK